MEDLFHCAIVAATELLIELELTHIDCKRGAIGKVDSGGVQDGFSAEIESSGRVAGG